MIARVAPLLLLLASAAGADPFGQIPGGFQEVEVAGTLDSRGVPVQARAVRSKANPLEVQRAIAKSFRKAGLYLPPPEAQFQLEGAPQLTGYDGEARRSYTAIFKRDGEGTLVILGSADLSTQAWRQAAPELPRFPGARHAIQSTAEGARTLAYQADATSAEVTTFYDDVLGSNGWAWSGGRWIKGDKALSLTLEKRPQGKLAVVLIEYPKGAQ